MVEHPQGIDAADAGAASRMRLQRYLARAGVDSRRHAEDLIRAGRVTVNGCVAQLGMSVDPVLDAVCVDGEPVSIASESMTIMLHKPCGYVTSMSGEQGRSVAELIPLDRYPALYHIGRLDKDTSGLLLFSTDGSLGHSLLHPSKEVVKTYYAQVEGVPDAADLEHLRRGIMLDGIMTAPADVELLEGEAATAAAALIFGTGRDDARSAHSGKAAYKRAHTETSFMRIAIHEGRTRQVRRMFEAVGHPVLALHRQSFGPFDLGDLPRGQWRGLSLDEVAAARTYTVI